VRDRFARRTGRQLQATEIAEANVAAATEAFDIVSSAQEAIDAQAD